MSKLKRKRNFICSVLALALSFSLLLFIPVLAEKEKQIKEVQLPRNSQPIDPPSKLDSVGEDKEAELEKKDLMQSDDQSVDTLTGLERVIEESKARRKKNLSPDIQLIDTPPELVREVEPVYPEEALKQRLKGTVIIQALISRTGNVLEADVAESSGHVCLDSSAVEAALKSKYIPAMYEGEKVPLWISYKVTFKL